MTLDHDVFCVKEPTVDSYVDELVHVNSTTTSARPGSSATIRRGRLPGDPGADRREDIDPFSASTYEKEGYALEKRFKAWRESKKLPEGPPDRAR